MERLSNEFLSESTSIRRSELRSRDESRITRSDGLPSRESRRSRAKFSLSFLSRRSISSRFNDLSKESRRSFDLASIRRSNRPTLSRSPATSPCLSNLLRDLRFSSNLESRLIVNCIRLSLDDRSFLSRRKPVDATRSKDRARRSRESSTRPFISRRLFESVDLSSDLLSATSCATLEFRVEGSSLTRSWKLFSILVPRLSDLSTLLASSRDLETRSKLRDRDSLDATEVPMVVVEILVWPCSKLEQEGILVKGVKLGQASTLRTKEYIVYMSVHRVN